jgi:hypothetical protein
VLCFGDDPGEAPTTCVRNGKLVTPQERSLGSPPILVRRYFGVHRDDI